MKLKVTDEKRFLIIKEATELEINQVEHSFTKKVDNWWIIKKKMQERGRNPDGWQGKIPFIDRYHRIPIGLWVELVELGKEYNFPVIIEEGKELLTDQDFDPQDFNKWVDNYFEDAKTEKGKDFFPYEYQLESARKAIKYRFCTEEISTSGGKTLISFIIFRYLLDRGKIKKLLYVVPNVDLVTQSYDEFIDYEAFCGHEKPPWKGEMIFSKAKKVLGEVQITFGTYQSLKNRDLDFFRPYDAVIIDETHHAKAKSIKEIITKCYNANFYRIGLTGTLPEKGSCDSFTIQSYLGPKVHVVYSHDLIDEGKATPVIVYGIELDYVDEDVKKKLYDLRNVKDKDGSKLLSMEKDVARNSRKRFNYIVSKISQTNKNSLVLFSDIKNGYGRKIFDWLKENTDKLVYYVDGNVENENREYYKNKMEDEESDVILVASVGTFSEGINIKNLHNIFITESNKSEFIVRQILGRGMRKMAGKEKVVVIDFSDNFMYGSNKWTKRNYLLKHADERGRIYKEKQFPYQKFVKKL